MSHRRGGKGGRLRHPPGLKGKEIGLFYRDLKKNEPKEKYRHINLKIPQPVLRALYNNIQSIEKIAQKENIYMSPKRMLSFEPVSDCFHADFVPLALDDSEKKGLKVSNIHKKDDVSKILQSEIIYLDSDPEDILLVSKAVKQETTVKNEYFVRNNCSSSAENIAKVIKKEKTPIKNEYFVRNNYGSSSTENIANVIKKETTPIKSEYFVGNNYGSSSTENIANVVKKETTPVKNEYFVGNNYGSSSTENIANVVKKETTPIKNEYFVENSHDSSTDNIANDIKNERTPVKNDYFVGNKYDSSTDNIDDVIEKETTPVKNEYFIGNNYGPSTSRTNSSISMNRHSDDYCLKDDTNDYKYGYDDIITGTFEEKLQESLTKGIEINIINEELRDLSLALKEELISNMDSRKYKDMMNFREKLPTYKKSEELIRVINDNQVIVISGETGCGKSTQIPQLILDDAIMNNKGANVRILVTEPRRIAASSLAMRVAEERAEKPGNSVGYAVRLEKVDCRPRGSIMFCTAGVLLVELEINQGLSNYSHVILDEVHERDCQIDISMCMLRQVLQHRKDLKLILMSATIDADKLCAYFNDCPLIHIEGLAYPVQDVYLEDILKLTKYKLPPADDRYSKKHFHGRRGGKFQASDMQKDIQYKAEIAPWLEANKNKFDKEVYKTLQDHRIESLDINLVLELLIYLCKGSPGAILVFLPGIGEITKLMRSMKESRAFPENRYDIHPLHSKLSTITQHKIFQRPPDHVRKIIIATNIAETSITVDDIVYVVDCGKIKYNGLNVEENISTLRVEWASQANLRQRRGRAGRCQPGICYHLVTSFRAEKLEERLLPELQRSDLLEAVLTIKKLRLGLADIALKMMPGVPAETTIKRAVRHLQQCGALDEKETLTPLGWHLARLPVHPAAGKLLLLGALFGCLDRAASVAAVWGFKDPFNLVIGKEREVEAAKKSLTLGEPSDHVAISEAIIQWENCGSYSNKRNFAFYNFLSMNTLELLSEMKKQFGNNLKLMGFLKSGNIKADWENRNSENMSLFKAIVAASLYPNIATVTWINKDMRNIRKPMSIKVRTPEEGSVSLHPSSVMFSKHYSKGQGCSEPLCANPGANWLVYWLKQRSSELFLIDVTLVYTLPLLFFGELNVTQAYNADECLISISTVKVCCKKETTQLLFDLRSLLDKVLASKIMVSKGESRKHSYFEEQVLNAVVDLITAEDERVEYMDEDEDSGEEIRQKRKRYWRVK